MILIKILPYNLTPTGVETFQFLTDLTAQRVDPPSLHPGELRLEASTIFTSPLRRATECIAVEQGKTIHPLHLLSEIPFELSDLCTEQEWNEYGSVIVRRRFKEKFIQDELGLSRQIMFGQIEDLISLDKALSGSVAYISHSFRMKLIEAYIRSHGKIVEQPTLIHEYIFDDQDTYAFGAQLSLTL
jgi:hypothetical protein